MTVLADVNPVHINDGRESMCRVDNSFPLHHDIKLTSDRRLRMRVQVTRRLVKQEYLGVLLQQAPGDEHALPLAARQLTAQVADLRLVPVLHGHDSVVDFALLGDFDDLGHGGVGVSVLQVEEDGVVEQNSVLRDDADVLAEAFDFQPFQILPINSDFSRIGIIDAEQKI